MKFLCSPELGRLAKWLRAVGYDATFMTEAIKIPQLLALATVEDRTILTRLKKLRGHRGTPVVYIASDRLEDQMKAINQLRWAVIGALSCCLPLLAHHSFAAEFDASKTVTLRGVISKVDWINPHIFVYVDVKDDAGKTTTWALQSLPPLFFRGSGLTKDVLLSNKQEVTFTANIAKDGTRAYGFMTKLSYPDGHVFSMSAQDADPSLKSGKK